MLIAMEQSILLNRYAENPYPGWTQEKIEFSVPLRERLLTISATYYKCALNLLKQDGSLLEGETTHLIMSLFDDLIAFYRRHNNLTTLESLLQRKTVTQFMKLPDIVARRPQWHAVLKELRGAAKRT